jgi:hypothetical protein
MTTTCDTSNLVSELREWAKGLNPEHFQGTINYLNRAADELQRIRAIAMSHVAWAFVKRVATYFDYRHDDVDELAILKDLQAEANRLWDPNFENHL